MSWMLDSDPQKVGADRFAATEAGVVDLMDQRERIAPAATTRLDREAIAALAVLDFHWNTPFLLACMRRKLLFIAMQDRFAQEDGVPTMTAIGYDRQESALMIETIEVDRLKQLRVQYTQSEQQFLALGAELIDTFQCECVVCASRVKHEDVRREGERKTFTPNHSKTIRDHSCRRDEIDMLPS